MCLLTTGLPARSSPGTHRREVTACTPLRARWESSGMSDRSGAGRCGQQGKHSPRRTGRARRTRCCQQSCPGRSASPRPPVRPLPQVHTNRAPQPSLSPEPKRLTNICSLEPWRTSPQHEPRTSACGASAVREQRGSEARSLPHRAAVLFLSTAPNQQIQSLPFQTVMPAPSSPQHKPPP